jgi:hypothetical protein
VPGRRRWRAGLERILLGSVLSARFVPPADDKNNAACSPATLCRAVGGCASTPAPHGEVKEPGQFTRDGQSDSNRVASLAMRANLDSLYLLISKLYRRNPAEWKKTAPPRRGREEGQASHRAAPGLA